MLKTGRTVGSDWEGADVGKCQYLPEAVRIPDFFDHWMEEYACKIVDRSVAPDTGKQSNDQNLGQLERKSLKRRQKKDVWN